ncbi:MAG: lactate racemase domain-containing protein [Candidatus Bathyarchaeota archaeon]|nr:lactate racemase domain-containing protein [Candidatus Bathyarchaeota archaeon]MDH5689130.1 lactate racemase domain-containing protein [Candidatus Bathyarchaeota archaeon]
MEITFGERSIELDVPLERLEVLSESPDLPELDDLEAAIEKALANPVQSDTLSESVKKGDRILIIVEDITRPSPVKAMVQPVLKELSQAGAEDRDITFIYAPGLHKHTFNDIEKKFGNEILDRFRVVDHDAYDPSQNVFLGFTSSGTPIWVNKAVNESDYIIGIGGVKPNFTPGFGGGCKIVMPGISSCETIQVTHADNHASDEPIQCGIPFGPIRKDIDEIGEKARLKFVLNVVFNRNRKIAQVLAGEPVQLYRQAMDTLMPVWSIGPKTLADVAIVSRPGRLRPLVVAYRSTKPGGTIIVPMGHPVNWAPFLNNRNSLNYVPSREIRDGLRNWERNPSIHWPFSIQLLMNPSFIKYNMGEFVRNALRWGWDIGPFRDINGVIMLRTVIELRKIVVVSDSADSEMRKSLNEYGIDVAPTTNEALEMAYKCHGRNARIAVVPPIDDFY